MHWDVDATISYVVMAHSSRTKDGGRSVANFLRKAWDRWAKDTESEILEDYPHATQVRRPSVLDPALASAGQDEHYKGCQHVKLVLVEYLTKCACISSANLFEAPMRDMYEFWFMEDFVETIITEPSEYAIELCGFVERDAASHCLTRSMSTAGARGLDDSALAA